MTTALGHPFDVQGSPQSSKQNGTHLETAQCYLKHSEKFRFIIIKAPSHIHYLEDDCLCFRGILGFSEATHSTKSEDLSSILTVLLLCMDDPQEITVRDCCPQHSTLTWAMAIPMAARRTVLWSSWLIWNSGHSQRGMLNSKAYEVCMHSTQIV